MLNERAANVRAGQENRAIETISRLRPAHRSSKGGFAFITITLAHEGVVLQRKLDQDEPVIVQTAMKLKFCFVGLLALVLIGTPILGLSQSFPLAAVVANQTIDWNGWKVVIDSFDSANPNWSTAGSYDPAKAKENGDVIVGGSITDERKLPLR